MGFLAWPATGPIGVLQPLKYIPENSMERLSVSESISKRWTTLKKQRWLESLQTVGSLISKYNGDKRDREPQKV